MQKEVLLPSSLMHSAAERAVPEDIFDHAALQRAASDTYKCPQPTPLLVNEFAEVHISEFISAHNAS